MMSVHKVDQVLVERFQVGERYAFDLLVVKYQQRLMRLVSRFVLIPSEAEDIVQETFIKVYTDLRYFRAEVAFYTWLCQIGIDKVRSRLVLESQYSGILTKSSQERTDAVDNAEKLQELSTPESRLSSKQIAREIKGALAALPLELRIAIVLRDLEGLRYDEISTIMECPVGTVRSRIFRAREIIAEKVERFIDLPKLDFVHLSRVADGFGQAVE